jgi:cyclic pyranopterin phosphate synthase
MSIHAETTHDRLGRALRDLRVSVTDRCNLRCTYCMPAELYGERYQFLPRAQLLSYEEIARLTGLFVRLGVSKVRITGGEPLVRTEIPRLVALLGAIEGVEDLTLTTNGFLLAQHAQALREAGLHRVTVSLDALNPDVFGAINGRGYSPRRVLEGIQAAAEAGLLPVKVNMVVQRGVNDHTIVDMARHFRGTGHILRFIEYMDVGNLNGWQSDQVTPSAELADRINQRFPIEPLKPSYPGEVAERYQYLDGEGEIGFISSVTQPFCGDCTRARLSPEGVVYTCLFAATGTDLRGPLRDGATDEELLDLMTGLWHARTDRYSELRASQAQDGRQKVEMYHIGG